MRARRLLLSAAPLALVGGAAAALPADPARPRFVLDAGAPLFAARDLVPGARRSACMAVRNAGGAPGRPALYAAGPRGALARHLRLTVARGATCADAAVVVYDGTLAAFPGSLATALAEPAVWAPGERGAYRFDLVLGSDPAAAGLSAAWDWRIAVEPAAVARSVRPATCERLSASRPFARRVRGVRVELRIRRARLEVRTRLRAARVRYRVNERAAGTSRRRPFRVRVPAAAFRPGRNVVRVVLAPRRGRARTAVFRLSAKPATTGGRRTCVLGA